MKVLEGRESLKKESRFCKDSPEGDGEVSPSALLRCSSLGAPEERPFSFWTPCSVSWVDRNPGTHEGWYTKKFRVPKGAQILAVSVPSAPPT